MQAPPRGEEPLLVEALRRLGARAVEREGERYRALLPPPRSVERLLRRAEALIRAGTSLREPWLEWRWQEREAWEEEWSRALAPRRVGDAFLVAPRGAQFELRPDDHLIRLVPGPGFGTAEHPTTRGCLRLLERFLRPGDRVADVGAGSGILSVAAALLGARRVLALERDPHACAAARENLAENGVADRVELRRVEAGPATLLAEPPFDGIAANLPGGILLPLFPSFAQALTPGGWLIASGVLPAEKAALLRAARGAGLRLEAEEEEEGWWSLCYLHPGRDGEPLGGLSGV